MSFKINYILRPLSFYSYEAFSFSLFTFSFHFLQSLRSDA